MIEITNASQFYDIVKSFKCSHQNILTNCYLMPDEINRLISQNQLSVQEEQDWLFILCDRDIYSNLYYYTTENSSADCVKDFLQNAKKEIYTDIVFRVGRGDLTTPEKLISSNCARKYKRYQRMQLATKDIVPSFSKIPEGYKLSFDFCDYDALSELWQENLDEKSTPLPQKDELSELCQNGNLLTIFDSHNKLAAAVVFSVSAKQALLQHVAVSKSHRRKGLALYLLNSCFSKAIDANLNALRLWVDCKNMSAIALYERLNFKNDGMLCDQLYMKGN